MLSSVWWPEVLKHILCAPRTAGLRSYHGEVIGEAVWEPILDRVSWERVRRLLLDPARTYRGPRRSYLLSGLVVCGRCGGMMCGHTSKGKPRYRCKTGCSMQILAEPLEALVLEAVSAVLATPAVWEAVAERDAGEDVRLTAEMDGLRARLEDLADMFASGEVTRVEWVRARRSLVARLDELGCLLDAGVRAEALRAMDGDMLRGRSSCFGCVHAPGPALTAARPAPAVARTPADHARRAVTVPDLRIGVAPADHGRAVPVSVAQRSHTISGEPLVLIGPYCHDPARQTTRRTAASRL